MSPTTDYSEAGERHRTAGQGLSHLSVEVGHFYMDDLTNGPERIEAQLRQVAPLLDAFRAAARAEFGPAARISTCFLIDDYFEQFKDRSPGEPSTAPTVILPKLLHAADECGVQIDYLVREAGCAEVPAFVDGEPSGPPLRLAEMMAARIVPEPGRGGNGRRPAAVDNGWLCNGRRSSEFDRGHAMRLQPWRPPEEFGARNHSIFLDVQLWNDDAETGTRRWSCPFLASIWQLLRLGMIRHEGEVVAAPMPWTEPWPDEWSKLPSVIQLRADAKAFAAYRALSVLPHNYLGIEHSVRVILNHLQLDDEVQAQLTERGGREPVPVTVPLEVRKRLRHVFLEED
ncbi:SCO2522 family protein [Nocardia yamanashiensis]|uniref:SCO2522 family protein n=1 Tax=Nocardia yamanashiensis TaxID=209247 RepID=UPI00082D410B|nr:SCO2522 family protein [Nocardia yamanashiensis]